MSELIDVLTSALSGSYTLERELGGGGMSRVFLAREVGLNRQVVVKVVPIEGGHAAVERFRREITTAAQLQHPHIVPVLSAGDAAGVPYFTMPYVPGDSLRARLAGRTPMPIADAIKILRDVAQALAFAHERGFVHRDIKPDNILLADGAAVVTDFGVAKALSFATGSSAGIAGDGMTAAGVSLGTPAYMAPEQVSADPGIDHRADLYAWGCVAYELFTGASPFGNRAPAKLFAAHLTETPLPVDATRHDVSPPLAALVMRCLEKDPAHRPQSAREVLAALDALPTPSTASTVATPSRGIEARLLVGAALLAVVLVVVFLVRARRTPSDALSNRPAMSAANDRADSATALSSLAVLPFVNTSGDAKDEYFSDGMTDELAHALSKLPGLRLAGRSSSFSFKGKSILAPDVGRTLGVGAIVEGTVRRAGDRIRLTAQLTRTRDGHVLWSDAFERSGADVFAVQDAFTTAIVSALSPRLGGATSVAAVGVPARGTSDAVAYDLYLRGRFYWAQRGAGPGDTAVRYLEEAVKRDSMFARGWAGLALAHTIHPNYNTSVDFLPASARAEVAARRALTLDSTLADAHSALGFLLLRRFAFPEAGAELATARRLEPQNAVAAHWSAIYFNAIGDTANSDRQMDLALTLDPLSPTTSNTQAGMRFERRRFSDALDGYVRIATISKNFPYNGFLSLVWSGKTDSAYRVSQRYLTSQVRGRFGFAVISSAASGRWAEARALRAQIAKGGPGVVAYDRALAEVAFGNRAAAAEAFVENLERGGGLANVVWSVCHPPYDAIRDEPAWKAFLVRHQWRDCPYSSPWPIGPVPALGAR